MVNLADARRVAELAKTLSSANLCLGTMGLVPVVDKTELQGVFDFKVTWQRCMGDGSDNTAATIGSALRDQLGLKLESVKVPRDFFYVDRVEKLQN